MGKIAVLDKTTIDKIAAGEVVERPSSVVKELTENAVDAGAQMITVELKEGGIGLIRITDNGIGIAAEDIPTAFLRHSTSKIRKVEDLLTAESLGFRGEALSSISSVAQVEMVTKTKSAFVGNRYVIEGGEEKKFEEIGCPDGTTFLIRNLFYNVPVRRKFLKSATTEAGYCSELMQRLALCRPDIAFKFINNDKIAFQTPGNGNLREIIYRIYGRDIEKNLEEVNYTEESAHITVTGFVGKPVIARGNRNYENFFVNGRYIRSSIISKAIEEAYRPYMMQHKYPFTVLHIRMNLSAVDVNVHPSKLEVRFSDSEGIYYAVYHAVKEALAEKNMIPQVSFGKEEKTLGMQPVSRTPEQFETRRFENRTQGSQPVLRQDSATSVGSKKDSELQTSHAQPSKELPPVKELPQTKEYAPASELQQTKQNRSAIELSKTKEYEPASELPKTKDCLQGKELLQMNECVPERNLPQTIDIQKNGNSGQEKDISLDKAEREEPTNQNRDIILENAEKSENIAESSATFRYDSEEQQLTLPNLLRESNRKEYRFLGQLFKTYWLIEMDEELFMIDQHAAHEKILYEQTMKRIRMKQMTTQMVIPPILVSLSIREEQALTEHEELLREFGYEFENFGGRDYKITGVPADLCGLTGKDFFVQLIDELTEERLKNNTPEELMEKVATMSCKAAVKGNQNLSETEAKQLIDLLLTLDNPYHCPHGRPTTISMTKQEIEKKFKRIL